MPIAGMGAGAADALTKLVIERRMQQALEAEIANRQASLAESQRSSMADEQARGRALDIQEQHYGSEERTRQRERDETQGMQALTLSSPGRIEPQVAQVIAKNPVASRLLKVRQTLPETEGVGPLEEPEIQRDMLPSERQQFTTNERLADQQRQMAADRAEDNARQADAAKEQQRQFGVTSQENIRYHNLMSNDRAEALAVRKTPKPTGMQLTELGFYNRMKGALTNIDAVEDALTERDIALINNSPLPELINNSLLSGAGQQYAQALRTYTEARLRKESGAAIAPHEFAADRLAISRQVNDQPQTLRQKRQTRQQTAEGFAFAAGPAYEEYYGEPFKRDGGGAASGVTVRLIAPDGSERDVPAAEAQHYISLGAKVKQ